MFIQSRGSGHVIVTGSINASSVDNLLQELFHDDHGFQGHKVIILGHHKPDAAMNKLIRQHWYSQWVIYVQGDESSHQVKLFQ